MTPPDDTFEHLARSLGADRGGLVREVLRPLVRPLPRPGRDWEALARPGRLRRRRRGRRRDRNPATCDRFDEHVRSFPTLLLFRDRGVFKYRGARDVDALEAFAREGYAADPGARGVPVPPEPTFARYVLGAHEAARGGDDPRVRPHRGRDEDRERRLPPSREGVPPRGGRRGAERRRRAFADAPKTYGCAALLVSVLGICLALVAALASAPIKRHPGSTKRKSE